MNIGQKISGRYEVIRKLGHGGMAEIYLVHDSVMDRDVALKFLPSDLKGQTGLRLRFEREVRTIASLEHSAIVPVHDVGDHEGQPYLVMRYMAGGSLTQRLDKLTLTETAVIFHRLAPALDKAHEKGFIHRDIKPDNILFDEEDQAYLADFGISRPTEEPSLLTQSGNAIGTPYYMSPEQIRGETLDGRSDIYSLGVMLFEMWAKHRPYQATTIYDLMNLHVQAPIPNILQYNPQLPPICQTIVNKAMAKQPKDRYTTARELAEAVSTVDQPVAVVQPTVVARPIATVKPAVAAPAPNVVPPQGTTVVEPPVVQPKPRPSQPALRKRANPLWWLVGIGVVVYGVWQLAFAGSNISNLPASSPTATPEPTTLELGIALGATRVRPADGMVMVGAPGGTFMMGSDPAEDTQAQDDEQPQHPVTLDDYWIDQTEVTNAQFALFIDVEGYETTAEKEGNGYNWDGDSWELIDGANWQQPQGPDSNINGLENHPVVLVSWYDADAYCRWAGGRLPTEAEWEYAARGDTRRIYSWDGSFDASRLNASGTGDGYERTAPVGSFSPAGNSWVEAQDMAGNVWEWVYDWYGAYKDSAKTNPSGPESGSVKVLRGGSWSHIAFLTHAANRDYDDPDDRYDSLGFRCVVPPGQ